MYAICLGYEDCNDVNHLKNDPAFQHVLDGELASQPTLSRFENSLSMSEIWRLSKYMIDTYISSLIGREKVVIDVDSTDNKTYGQQQGALFNGFDDHTIYNQLFFHDGEIG